MLHVHAGSILLPLRRYLFLLAIAGILPLAALCGVGLLALYAQQREEALVYGRDISRALATAVNAQLQSSIAALQVLATSPLLERGDLQGFRGQALRALEARRPDWAAVHLTSPEGMRLVDTTYELGAAMSPVVETQSHDLAVWTGRPVVGTLARGVHEQAFALRVPVIRDGGVRYVLNAVVKPATILEMIRRQQVPEDWVIAVFDSNGIRVARSRGHEAYLGVPASDSLRELMAQGSSEGSGLTHAMEGDAVFTAYARMPNGWSVAIGIPEASVGRAAWRSTAFYAVAVAASILAGLFAALWLARRANESMRQLREAALALGRGEQPAQMAAPISEVREVGAAIVESARQRRAFEAERERLFESEQAARAQAETANRAKDQFLAMLAHELRNPLGAISNAASLLDDERANPQALARARGVIQRQTRHLSRLTDDLLDAARALMGKIKLESRAVDLGALASQAVKTFGATGRTANHHVVESIEPCWAWGDPVRLEQVISNLLENAVKYTPPGGTIEVSCSALAGECVLRVRDNGHGIPPELSGRVFDLFVQGPRDIDRRQGGLGIGLTLVKRLAELHGGHVAVHSEGDGRGSEFTVRIPEIAKPVAAEVRAGPTVAEARSILLVEDNDDGRETLQALLEMSGHTVEAARDGATGLDKALALAPDVAIVDIGLPVLDGYEVARRLRAAGIRRTLLLALTGYGTEADRARVLAAGFDAHLTKPANIAELLELIAKWKPEERETGKDWRPVYESNVRPGS